MIGKMDPMLFYLLLQVRRMDEKLDQSFSATYNNSTYYKCEYLQGLIDQGNYGWGIVLKT
jgi:hypothetical protein